MSSYVINPYDLLGISTKTTKEELRKRYYELSLLMHPDKGGSKDDMIILHNSYRYVLKEVENIDYSLTVEKLESDFKEFCNLQEKEIPLFRDIYAEAFDLPIFNLKFENALESGHNTLFSASLEGGYGNLMDASSNDINYNPDTEKPKNEFTAISVYKCPVKEQQVFNNVYDFTKQVDNYTTDTNGLYMTDYKEAYTPIVYNEDDVPVRSLEDIKKERDHIDNNPMSLNYMWSFKGFHDANGNIVENILRLE